MKKNIKLLFVLICAILLTPRLIAAAIDTDEIIKKIAPDGENAVFYMKEPTTPEESDFAVSGYIGKYLGSNDYQVNGYYSADGCTVTFSSLDYMPEHQEWDSDKGMPVTIEGKGWTKSYTLNVTFEEPKTNEVITDYFTKLKDFSPSNPETYYIIEDLSLINYYLTSNKSELWNAGAPGRALKYSTLNTITKNSNVSYYLEIRAGNQDENMMFESAFGPMSVFYNGYTYGTKEQGVYLRRVIYIPEDTENTTDAYALAAQKRINEYLGDDKLVKVTYGNTLSSLPPYSIDEVYEVESDGNYYNVLVGEKTYKFYIVKGSVDKLAAPNYEGTDIETNVIVSSTSSSIPLDTSLTVKNVIDETIKEKIGYSDYKTYDISLYSDAKGDNIRELENGKFLVSIPIPSEFAGRDLTVYYLPLSGEIEEHKVTVINNYATFETDHFSTYTLAATSNKTNNPQTSDNISYYVILMSLCLICVVSLVKFLPNN